MFKRILTVVFLSISYVNASENVIENPISYSFIQDKSTQDFAQVSQKQHEFIANPVEKQKETNSWLQSCWNFTSNVAKGTMVTLAMAYVVIPMAVDGLWTIALSEGTTAKCARSVLRFFKPSINYITTNSINHFFKLI